MRDDLLTRLNDCGAGIADDGPNPSEHRFARLAAPALDNLGMSTLYLLALKRRCEQYLLALLLAREAQALPRIDAGRCEAITILALFNSYE